MQFAALRYFLEVAQSGSIRRAAEVLHVASSAISRQIALLEEDFGAPLFERHPMGVKLTAAGELFSCQAKSTLRDFERLRSEIDDLQHLKRGHVKICCSEGAVADLLFTTLTEFSQRHPGITYDVVVMGSRQAIDTVAEEECDLAIVFNPEPHTDIAVLRSVPHPVCLVMHPDHPLAKQHKIQLNDLRSIPVCMLDQTFAVRRLIDRALAIEGISIPIALTINTVELAKAYVKDLLGVTFLPLYAVRRELVAGTLKATIIDNLVLTDSTVALCMHKNRTVPLAAEALMRALVERFDRFAAQSIESAGK